MNHPHPPSSKKRKRKNVKIPSEIVQNESLDIVASPIGPIRSVPVTIIDKDVLLQRLKIEILDKYYVTKDSSSSSETTPQSIDANQTNGLKILHQCLLLGTNQCTRALEKAAMRSDGEGETSTATKNDKLNLKPALVMLARNTRPPTIVAHIPYLCKQLNIPIVFLPGSASSDLGRLFHTKRASIVLFMTSNNNSSNSKDKVKIIGLSKNEKDIFRKINSYVGFAISKIPLQKEEKQIK